MFIYTCVCVGVFECVITCVSLVGGGGWGFEDTFTTAVLGQQGKWTCVYFVRCFFTNNIAL